MAEQNWREGGTAESASALQPPAFTEGWENTDGFELNMKFLHENSCNQNSFFQWESFRIAPAPQPARLVRDPVKGTMSQTDKFVKWIKGERCQIRIFKLLRMVC